MAHSTKHGGFQSTALYRLLLAGPAPRGPIASAPDLWPGNPDQGLALLNGAFACGGESHHLERADRLPIEAGEAWLTWFHALDWVNDLRALSGGERGGEAPYFTREWLSAWMETTRHYHPWAWRADVTARRIVTVLKSASFLAREDAAGAFDKALRKALARDVRHLGRAIPGEGAGYPRLLALKALAFANLALNARAKDRTLARLDAEINAQVLPDGGHVERNPERLAEVLGDLLEIKAMVQHVTGEVPRFVQNAIDRAAPMLRQLRHPDGRLAVFNGGLEGDPQRLDLVLSMTDAGASAPGRAPYAGFQRLNAGNVVVIQDCGMPGGPGLRHHAGTLSFEMSVGPQRVIVNCGARSGHDDPWRTALAATAAHSTLTVNDTSLAAFAIDGSLHRGPEQVTCQRNDAQDGILVETSHDGYLAPFGLVHRRALYVGPGGDDVRGEDRLSGSGGEHFAVRFHLHPAVKASLLGDGAGVLLRFGHKGRETWRLRASLGDVRLEESVYLGRAGEVRRTEQIVISGPLTGNGVLVKWALTREGG